MRHDILFHRPLSLSLMCTFQFFLLPTTLDEVCDECEITADYSLLRHIRALGQTILLIEQLHATYFFLYVLFLSFTFIFFFFIRLRQ